MKNVLIITKIGKNFGALLQAYALKKTFENKGCKVNILNYCLANTMRTYEIYPKITGWSSLMHFLKVFRVRKEIKTSVQRFLQFRKDELNLTKEYRSYLELQSAAPDADIYVTGSDQVWNPEISFDCAYYLQFGRNDAVRASYAASIGLNKIPEKYEKEFIERILNIPFCSVRENTAQKILSKYNISSSVHVDPTLLLDRANYDSLAVASPVKRPYVLLYLLIMPDNVKEYLDELKTLYPNCIFINIPGSVSAKPLGDIQMHDVGPREFLGLIRDAEAILTTSFHGTVFSLVYEKQFMAVLPCGTGSRISGLLESMKLVERIASGGQDVKQIKHPIDYGRVREDIKTFKSVAHDYIDSIISECSGGK